MNKSRSDSILGRFPDVCVAVCGDVMLDRYLIGSVERVSPEAPVPVLKLENERLVPGGAANVAANVVGLGCKVHLMSVIGTEKSGEDLKNLLVETGIDTGGIIESGSRTTTVKSRIMAESHQIARVDRESATDIEDQDTDGLVEFLQKAAESVDVLVISDYGKGIITGKSSKRLIATAREHGIPVLVDPKGLDFAKYAGATLLTPNQKEALEIYHAETRLVGDVFQAGEYILKNFDIEELLVTLGADGMALFSKGEDPATLSATARNVFDVTGAGDTVVAATAAAKAAGADLTEAAVIANAAAGCVVEKVGTTAIKIDELKANLVDFEKGESNRV